MAHYNVNWTAYSVMLGNTVRSDRKIHAIDYEISYLYYLAF